MDKLLTIGMAEYKDFEGTWFTIRSILNYHQEIVKYINFVVIDNTERPEENWATSYGKRYKQIKVVQFPNYLATSKPRDLVVEHSETDWVMVVDSHVLFYPKSLMYLIEDIKNNRLNPNYLYQGPLLADYWYDIGDSGEPELYQFSTLFDTFWRDEMFGGWSVSWYCKCKEFVFHIRPSDYNLPSHMRHDNSDKPIPICHFYYTPDGPVPADERAENHCKPIDHCPKCGFEFPRDIGYPSHERLFKNYGFIHSVDKSVRFQPFDIPACGLGCYLVNKKYYPGFHPEARGFGGEEWYIHEKYRRMGGRAQCLPYLWWMHYFGPREPRAPVRKADKVRNYLLEWLELDLDYCEIYEHFVKGKNNSLNPMSEEQFNLILQETMNLHFQNTFLS